MYNRRAEAIVQPNLIVDYDPHWPKLFVREANRIRSVLGKFAVPTEEQTELKTIVRSTRSDIVVD